jgi:hypothetical protein
MIISNNYSTRDRERFFFSTVGCRRRMERKWQETPLAKVFTVPDEVGVLILYFVQFFILTLNLSLPSVPFSGPLSSNKRKPCLSLKRSRLAT